ncbi:MAG: imidazoleglycerol-phosphate dehydratase HisB [Mailhella sp.]|nr:imidazoleglycerol-phosphate dehydratase HisB [Mailhella sp.]
MSTIQRKANISRRTNETDISLSLNLDGTGKTSVRSGMGFLDHMLTLLAFWAKFDLELTCKGDTHIDFHHSVEDIGLCLGKALHDALLSHNGANGIERTGFAKIPMDEALTEVCLDLSGRAWLEWRNDELLPPVIAGDEKDVWREFYKAFASSAKMNLHIQFLYGKNGHHLLESAAKGTGKALRRAVVINDEIATSTKGSLDL